MNAKTQYTRVTCVLLPIRSPFVTRKTTRALFTAFVYDIYSRMRGGEFDEIVFSPDRIGKN